LNDEEADLKQNILDKFQTYLSEHVWVAIIVMLVFYTLILIFAESAFIELIGSNIDYKYPFLKTIFSLSLLALYFFLLTTIRFSKLHPILLLLLLGIMSGVITLLCILFASKMATLIEGNQIINFRYFLINRGDRLYTSLIPGIFEEIAFRGVILALLLKKYKTNLALLLKKYKTNEVIIYSSVLFSSFHLVNLLNVFFQPKGSFFSSGLSIINGVAFQLIYTLAMGFFFAYLTIKSKSLLPVIISHYLIDGFGSLPVIISHYLIDGFGSLFQLVYYVNQELFLAFQTFFGIGILASVINITLLKLIPNKWFSEQEIKKSALFFEE